MAGDDGMVHGECADTFNGLQHPYDPSCWIKQRSPSHALVQQRVAHNVQIRVKTWQAPGSANSDQWKRTVEIAL